MLNLNFQQNGVFKPKKWGVQTYFQLLHVCAGDQQQLQICLCLQAITYDIVS